MTNKETLTLTLNSGGKKMQGKWKKFRVGGKKYFLIFCVLSQRYLGSLTKLLRSLAKIFGFSHKTFAFSRKILGFSHKTFAFSRKDTWVLSQNVCVLSQRYLRSLAKLLHSLTKPVEFGHCKVTLPVYFTACSGYSSYVHNGSIK